MQIGQRVAVAGMLVSGALALIKIFAGLAGHSTAVVADGLESAADVIASGFVLFGLTIAARPADENHPYGHGRVETLTGLVIGFVLTGGAEGAAGGIRYRAAGAFPVRQVRSRHDEVPVRPPVA
jgi:cation diffusion facilitator family transporter